MIAIKILCFAISILFFGVAICDALDIRKNYQVFGIEELVTRIIAFIFVILLMIAPVSWFLF